MLGFWDCSSMALSDEPGGNWLGHVLFRGIILISGKAHAISPSPARDYGGKWALG